MTESAPIRRSLLTPFVIWFLVLCASYFVMLGEMVWLVFLLWLPFFVWTRWNSRAAMIVGCLCVVVLIAHSRGHKIIGSPRVVANRPFEPDVYIAALGPGTTVMLSDGRSFRLSGLKEKRTTEGQGALGPSWGIAGRDKEMRRRAVSYDIHGGLHDNIRWSILDERLDLWETEDGIPVQIKDEGNGSAQMTVGRGGKSWCGNSFFPTFFPRNLHRFGKTDLGLLLILTGAVEPDGTARDAAYQAQMNSAYQNNQTARDHARKEASERAKTPTPK